MHLQHHCNITTNHVPCMAKWVFGPPSWQAPHPPFCHLLACPRVSARTHEVVMEEPWKLTHAGPAGLCNVMCGVVGCILWRIIPVAKDGTRVLCMG